MLSIIDSIKSNKIWNSVNTNFQIEILDLLADSNKMSIVEFNNNNFNIPPLATTLFMFNRDLCATERQVLGMSLVKYFESKGYKKVPKAQTINCCQRTQVLRTYCFIQEVTNE